MKKKSVKVGKDDYRKLIESNGYYVDKTLIIQEFLDYDAEVTLITRPRRFGKTLNMTMISEFFDITKESKDIFKETKIMDTEYADMINTKPVVFYSFKDCNGKTKRELLMSIKETIYSEYERYNIIFGEDNIIPTDIFKRFIMFKNKLMDIDIDADAVELEAILPNSIKLLTQNIYEHYKIKPIMIIDEYDNPFIEGKNGGYYDEIKGVLSSLFVTSFKGNKYLEKTIMTGIQRIAHESIFSKFNNPEICTVIDDEYYDKFGLTEKETKEYLEYFGYKLTSEVKDFYNGYRFVDEDIYNPMSITSYIMKKGRLRSFWVNTSANTIIKEEIPKAGDLFLRDFDKLIENGSCEINVDFTITFSEEQSAPALWGLLINAGYVTVDEIISLSRYRIRIPNEEVKFEFKRVVANNYTKIGESLLEGLFRALLNNNRKEFISLYKDIVLRCTSYYDATLKENSYHMLMLGMSIYLEPRYKVESNIENGTGRSDITIIATKENDINVVIEFKYLEEDEKDSLKDKADEALKQIYDNKYYCKMKGKVLLLGVAHNKKQVEIVDDMITV